MLTIQDIRNALENINDHIHKTPLIYSNSFSKMAGAEIYLKAENLQKTGSFKVRGAFNKMARIKGNVIAASMGNHAQAVAFAAGKTGKEYEQTKEDRPYLEEQSHIQRFIRRYYRRIPDKPE